MHACVMHAHYDVLLCISAHRNKNTEFVFMIFLHKEDEIAEQRT